MALIYFQCTKCKNESRRIFKIVPTYKNWGLCHKCGGKLERKATGQSSQVMETLDNGAMRKSVTRLSSAERLFSERQAADPSKKTTEYV